MRSFIVMDGFNILLLSLSVVLIVQGKRQMQMTSKFDIQEGISVNSSIEPLELHQNEFPLSCAAQCNKNTECCSATYTTDDMSCRLYSCCFPPTVTTTGAKYLRRFQKQGSDEFPADCSELPPESGSGVNTIAPTNTLQIDVYCDLSLGLGTGWTVIQRRIDGTVDFNVTWKAYKEGFGDIRKEFWIGNSILNIMSNLKRYILRFDMEDSDGVTAYAEYDTFTVADECSQYELTIGGYSGTAGNSAMTVNGMKFSTLDHDNDISRKHCAKEWSKGGWWYRYCTEANPNGLYRIPGTFGNDIIFWKSFRQRTALKTMSMKIKPF